MPISQNLLNYVNDLYGSNNSYVGGINSNVVSTNTSLDQLDGTQKNALSKQNDIKDIITSENDRLNLKKTTIDQAILSQNRIIYFNDNNRKIYGAYLRILIVLTITLAIVWLIRVIRKHVEIIPGWIFDICMTFTICIGFIFIYNYYIDIRARNSYNFDEIKLDPPIINPVDSSSTTAVSTTSPISDSSGNICVGKDCCPDTNVLGPTWSEDQGKCIIASGESFVTMNSVKPADAFEYNDYSPYK